MSFIVTINCLNNYYVIKSITFETLQQQIQYDKSKTSKQLPMAFWSYLTHTFQVIYYVT